MTTTDRQKKISYWPTALTIADSDCSGGAGTGHDSEMCRVAARKQVMDDVLLSPIFDSISKKGYASAFSPSQLEEAASQGIIDHQVVALGGVTLDKLPLLESWHFGGAAMLGSIWQQPFAF